MEYIVEEVLEITIEILLILCLYGIPKSNARKKIIISIAIATIPIIVIYFANLIKYIGLFDLTICFFLAITLIEEKPHQKLLSFILIYGLTSLVYQCTVILVDLFLKRPIFLGMDRTTDIIYAKISTILLLCLLYIYKIKSKYLLYINQNTKIILCLSTYVISISLTFLSWKRNEINKSLYVLLSVIPLTVIFIIFVYLYTASKKNQEIEQNRVNQEYIKILQNYYNQINQNQNDMRKFQHDLNNHFRILLKLTESSNITGIRKYLMQFQLSFRAVTKTSPNIGNILVNAIISLKINEYPNIQINCNGSLREKINMNDFDLCILLTNLLDNALEYTSNQLFKSIQVNFYQNNMYLIIQICNDIDTEFTLKQLGQSTKRSPNNHGFGLNNIRDCVERTSSTINYSIENQRLIAEVRIMS